MLNSNILALSLLHLSTILSSSSKSLANAFPSTGCDPKAPKPVEWKPQPGDVKLFRVNDRNVRVTVPSKFDAKKPASLIVAYHDQDSSAEVLDYETGFSEDKVNEDVVVVYPAADNGRWSSELRPISKTIESLPKSENYTTDVAFTKLLLHDLTTLLCVDTTRIYATGLGSGGGMMHLLACDDELSTQFAAFAAVGGGFGRASKKKPQNGDESVWQTCSPGRENVPIMEIHGTDDGIFGYYLREGENGKVRTIPKDWAEEWSERNGCGEGVDDAVQSDGDTATFVTELENGVMTETVEFGGAVTKSARQCLASKEDSSRDKQLEIPNSALKTKDSTVVHYQIKGYGHGWPRQQLRGETEVMFKDTLIQLDTSNMFFDTSKVVLDFFDSHKLPETYAKQNAAAAGGSGPEPLAPPQMQMPTAEDFEAKLREISDQGPGKMPKFTEKQIREKVLQFKNAQLQKAEGYKEEVVYDEPTRDEL